MKKHNLESIIYVLSFLGIYFSMKMEQVQNDK